MNIRGVALVFGCLALTGLASCSSSAPPPPPPAPVAAAPAPPPPPPPAMPPNLTAGQQKVAKLQMALNANGGQVTVDGKMGPATVAALKTFQTSHNLKPTGHVDAATLKALGG